MKKALHYIISALSLFVTLASCNTIPKNETPPPIINYIDNIHSKPYLIFGDCIVTEHCGSRDQSLWSNLGDKEILYKLTAHITCGMPTKDINVIMLDSVYHIRIPHCEMYTISIPDDEIVLEYKSVTGISSEYTATEENKIKVDGENRLKASLSMIPFLDEADLAATRFFSALAEASNVEYVIEYL